MPSQRALCTDRAVLLKPDSRLSIRLGAGHRERKQKNGPSFRPNRLYTANPCARKNGPGIRFCGAEGGNRTPTGLAHSALNTACLPVPPLRHCLSRIRYEDSGLFPALLPIFLRSRARSLVLARGSRGIKHDRFLLARILLSAYIGKSKGCAQENRGYSRSQLCQQASGTAAPEKALAAASENNSHALLAGLQKDQDNQGDTSDNMNSDY